MYEEIISFIKSLYPNKNPVILHEPDFMGNEKKYLEECIDSTFVSYVGEFVTKFEEITANYVGAKYAIAVVNGTAALQIALQIAGVKRGDEVITQSLTFVATANAISHCGAKPVFVDVDTDTMGMSPEKLDDWLSNNVEMKKCSLPIQDHFTDSPAYDSTDGRFNEHYRPFNRISGNIISAIVPMHTFGLPCRIDEIVKIAERFNIPVIEDSAESLGSMYRSKHTGTFGLAGIFSYNGNKTITTGGGGMIITDNERFAKSAIHISTTAKKPHKWEYIHDKIGYNYRLTNLNAAVGVAQMEKLDDIIENKRLTAEKYKKFFSSLSSNIFFVTEPKDSYSNYWLNCIKFEYIEDRNRFLEETNASGVMTRPIWRLMNKLAMYQDCLKGNLDNSEWLEDRIVNLPSGYRNS